VNPIVTIRRLFAILLIAGLAMAPLPRMAMAQGAGVMQDVATQDVATSDDGSAAMLAEMADEMPCCPAKAPMPDDCDRCAVMAGCMAKCVAGPGAAVVQRRPAIASLLGLPQNESWPEGLGQPPPDHPPRILV
jgi:hypothetical protein